MAGRKNKKAEVDESPPKEMMTAQSRYTQLATDREPYLFRGREASKLTIPSLLPDEGSSGATTLHEPWQSVGAEGVNNLASKLMLVLFPPGASYFRLSLDESTMQELVAQGGPDTDVKAEIEEALGKVERAVVQRLEQRGARMQLFEAFKHLLVTGNALIQVLPDERLKLHKLDRYVIKRDQQGNAVEMVVKETVAKVTLSPELQKIVDENPISNPTSDKPEATVDIYTHLTLKENKWNIRQEIHGKTVPKSEGFYPKDRSAWIPLRFVAVDGEDYGRGFVEEHIGALRSFDSLSQVIVEASAICGRIIFLCDEAGVTDRQQVTEAPNGGMVPGRRKDIETLQVEKFFDLQVTLASAQDIKKDLQRAFLLFAGAQRQAERVTAEEIRLIVQELEVSFGGSYSVQTTELQVPLTHRWMLQMQKRDELPRLPKDVVSIQIVTGLAGLGRSSDLNKLDLLLAGVAQIFGPDAVEEYCSAGSYIKRKATALSIDVSGMIRSDEQVAERRNQAAQMELAKSAMGPTAKLAGQVMEQDATPTQ